jgi:hemerythrin
MSQTFFQWNDKLDLKIKNMDDEHHKLVDIMNALFDLNEKKAPFAQISAKIDELEKWTILHFSHEEAFFTGIAYKKAEAHKLIHKDLLQKLKTHAADIRKQQKIDASFFSFLKVWLTAHIMGIDTGYADVQHQKAS